MSTGLVSRAVAINPRCGVYSSLPSRLGRGNFDWRGLRGLGRLLGYVFADRFQYARSARWKWRREYRHSSLPSR